MLIINLIKGWKARKRSCWMGSWRERVQQEVEKFAEQGKLFE